MLCKECNQYEVEGKRRFINQPKDTCFECWFKRDIATENETGIKPYFTNKEVRKMLVVFGSIFIFTGLIIGYTLGLAT